MKKYLKIFILLLLATVGAYAQEEQDDTDMYLDSLVREADMAKSDTMRLRLLHRVALEHYNVDSTYKYATRLFDLATKMDSTAMRVRALRYLSWSYYNKYENIKCIEMCLQALELAKEVPNEWVRDFELGHTYIFLADATSAMKDETKANEYYMEAFKYLYKTKRWARAAMARRNVAHTAIENFMWSTADEHLREAYRLDSLEDYQFGVYNTMYYYAYMDQYKASQENDPEKRDSLLRSGHEIAKKVRQGYEELESEEDYPYVINLIAVIRLMMLKDPLTAEDVKALEECAKDLDYGLEICEKIGNEMEGVDLLNDKVRVLAYQKRFAEADSVFDVLRVFMFEDENRKGGNFPDFFEAKKILETQRGNLRGALEAADSMHFWSLKMNKVDFAVRSTQNMMQLEFHDKEITYAAEVRQRRIVNISLVIGLLLAGVTIFVTVRSSIRRRRDNQILDAQNSILAQQEEELRVQNEQLERKNEEVSRVNREMRDSIEYARLIQMAAMPTSSDLQDVMGESFVLLRPLGIVSGDYLWVGRSAGLSMLAVADCTGHGVPGAFMSMLGLSMLQNMQYEISRGQDISPARVLEGMREQIKRSLHQDSGTNNNHDGMDMGIVAYDGLQKTLYFAGALRPLVICRGNGMTETVDADRMPIGIHYNEQSRFTDHRIELESGDMFYLFSDGVTDQFGVNEDGQIKKFTRKRLVRLLSELRSLPVQEQRERIADVIDKWRCIGLPVEQEQTDDTLIVGVRV